MDPRLARSATLLAFLVCVACHRAPPPSPDSRHPSADEEAVAIESPAEQPPLVRGTHVRVVPPEGFAPAETFPGYQHADTNASVLVTEMPVPFDATVAGFETEEMMRPRGMRVLAASDRNHGTDRGRLLHVEQRTPDATVQKWLWVFGNADATVMVIGTCFEQHCSVQLDALKASVTSAVWDAATASDPLAGLGFALNEVGGLRLASRVANVVMYTDSGEVEVDAEHGISFTAGPALGSGPIEDQRAFVEARTRQLPLKNLKIETIDPVTIDGMSGYEVTGTCQRDEFEHVVYVAIVFEPSNYWIATGQAPVGKRSEYVPLFRQIAASLTRDGAR